MVVGWIRPLNDANKTQEDHVVGSPFTYRDTDDPCGFCTPPAPSQTGFLTLLERSCQPVACNVRSGVQSMRRIGEDLPFSCRAEKRRAVQSPRQGSDAEATLNSAGVWDIIGFQETGMSHAEWQPGLGCLCSNFITIQVLSQQPWLGHSSLLPATGN
jgi:hypothetical protein